MKIILYFFRHEASAKFTQGVYDYWATEPFRADNPSSQYPWKELHAALKNSMYEFINL